ncbi:MAG: nucleotidyltransferase family protein [Betaproteobacteria bacterium]|nr:nucleotidyltransferase family protein [Burkholderiales bacterium]NBX91281.1 nucleotidyltransferase family protein [Betaproteobacteria bacterium]
MTAPLLKCPVSDPSEHNLDCAFARIRVVAVLLAAGTASRMGGRPKCLLQVNGQPLAQGLLQALALAGVDETVLVLGHCAEQVQNALAHFSALNMPVCQVLNSSPQDGQNSSLRIGLAKANTLAADWVMVALADQPLINAQDLQDLIAAVKHRPPGTRMLVPQVDGLPGNPVLFDASVMAEILTATPDMGGKQWQQAHPTSVYQWATANTHYRIDVDSPADIDALAATSGLRLQWD